MICTYLANQLAVTAAGARPCALGDGWQDPAFVSVMKHRTATSRPLGRLPD